MAQELLIRNYLKQLKLPAITQSYTKLAREAAEANMPYEGYLLALLELEVAHRTESATKKRIARAHFPYLRTLDQFDFSALPSLNKAVAQSARKCNTSLDYLSWDTRPPARYKLIC